MAGSLCSGTTSAYTASVLFELVDLHYVLPATALCPIAGLAMDRTRLAPSGGGCFARVGSAGTCPAGAGRWAPASRSDLEPGHRSREMLRLRLGLRPVRSSSRSDPPPAAHSYGTTCHCTFRPASSSRISRSLMNRVDRARPHRPGPAAVSASQRRRRWLPSRRSSGPCAGRIAPRSPARD